MSPLFFITRCEHDHYNRGREGSNKGLQCAPSSNSVLAMWVVFLLFKPLYPEEIFSLNARKKNDTNFGLESF